MDPLPIREFVQWATPYAPGVAGALISLKWAGCGWGEKIFAFGSGMACAVWVAPAVCDLMGMQTATVPRLVSLFLGMFGARMADPIAQSLRDLRIDLPAIVRWALAWLPGARR